LSELKDYSFKYEYVTTCHTFQLDPFGMLKQKCIKVLQPEGDNWELVSTSVLPGTIFYSWRRFRG
jgi:hypothetical protein